MNFGTRRTLAQISVLGLISSVTLRDVLGACKAQVRNAEQVPTLWNSGKESKDHLLKSSYYI